MAQRRRTRSHDIRIQDIAHRAGVGTATVDRVLNDRGGVSPATAERVRRAVAEAGGTRGADIAAAATVGLALPARAGPSTDVLARAFARECAAAGLAPRIERYARLDPQALAAALTDLSDAGCEAIAFQALEHPFVREAAARLSARGVPLVTLLSDLAGSGAAGFVGTDNRAAGRTAGALMGRFSRGEGRVAIVWGGTLYRSHEEREIGFRTVLRETFPKLAPVDITAGGDDEAGNFREVSALVGRERDLVGVYSVGGGTGGVIAALEEAGRARAVVMVAHNICAATQRALVSGTLDAVIDQDVARAAREAVAALSAALAGTPAVTAPLPVTVILKENMPVLGADYAEFDGAADARAAKAA